nr:IS110 family transposase [Salinisphaera halophila]
MTSSMTIAVDLAKTVFEIAIADAEWRIVERHRLSRAQFQTFFFNRESATIVMEACGTAHFWGRWLTDLGFSVRLIPAHYARPYRRRNKNDAADAAALVEAARNAEIIDVPVKSADQQAIQGLHRIRSQWMATRTARINNLRGLLREQGINIPVGAATAVSAAPALIDSDAVPAALRAALQDIISEIHELEARMKTVERQLKQYAATSRDVQSIQQVPGVGLLTATALVAAVGSPDNFRDGRHLAAWMGLTPRHVGSGHRMHRGGISKRGDRYLRMLLIHGARSVLIRAQLNAKSGQPLNRLQQWALDLRQRSNHNKTTCALANKLARIAWAVWAHDRNFDGNHSLVQAA